jgi:HAD superfamily hydrolase (TIGR01509 family)
MKELSLEKERRYQQEFLPKLSLIPGLQKFLEKAKQLNIPMAIGTAAIPFNVDFVLDNLKIRNFFEAIVSADDVTESKPNPETFIKCAQILDMEPSACIVFEDAPKGIEAALNAGMESVVLTTMHPAEDFSSYKNVISFIKDYSTVNPHDFVKAGKRVNKM